MKPSERKHEAKVTEYFAAKRKAAVKDRAKILKKSRKK